MFVLFVFYLFLGLETENTITKQKKKTRKHMALPNPLEYVVGFLEKGESQLETVLFCFFKSGSPWILLGSANRIPYSPNVTQKVRKGDFPTPLWYREEG